MRFLIVIVFLFFGCAQIVAPTGGEADKSPPKILRSEPIIGQNNYNKRRIVLEFDEFVQVQNLGKELIVSPPLKNLPDFILKQKKLIFTWTDSLIPNTTYYFNFGQSISDINEGNKLDSNVVVFSTGEHIDSLNLRGKVINALTLKPEEGIYVLLYPQMGDSIPSKIRPTYFGKTDEQGNFSISYIKERVYQIFALRDNNSNYLFDLPNEMIAFSTDYIIPIYTDSSVALPQNIVLKAFEENREKQYLKEGSEVQYGKLQFVFNLPVDSQKLRIENMEKPLPKDQIIQVWSSKNDTLVYWISQPELFDTLDLEVAISEEILDTVTLFLTRKTAEVEDSKRKNKNPKTSKKSKISLKLSTSGDKNNFGAHSDFYIETNHPINTFDTSKILLFRDTIPQEFEVEKVGLNKLKIIHTWKEDDSRKMLILPGAVSDIFGLSNDSLEVKFKPKGEAEYGFFYLNIALSENSFPHIIEIYLADKLQSTSYVTGNDTLTFEFIKPGSYQLKAIEDRNGNKKWDAGIYGKKEQAEKVFFFKNNVDIRANWETFLDWNLDE